MNFSIPLITNDSKATVYSKFFAITSSLLRVLVSPRFQRKMAGILIYVRKIDDSIVACELELTATGKDLLDACGCLVLTFQGTHIKTDKPLADQEFSQGVTVYEVDVGTCWQYEDGSFPNYYIILNNFGEFIIWHHHSAELRGVVKEYEGPLDEDDESSYFEFKDGLMIRHFMYQAEPNCFEEEADTFKQVKMIHSNKIDKFLSNDC